MIQTNELILPEGIDFALLEKARKDLKWSIEITAQKANLAEGTTKNILNGTTKNPGAETLRKLCDALNVPVDKVVKSNRMNEIENKGIKLGDESILALKEIYEIQIANMKETSEIHINNIRTHYEQHHQDLVENFEKRLSDKRELIESYKEQIRVLSEDEDKQIKDLKKANLIKNIIIGFFVCGVIALFVLELLHPEHGWLRY